MSQLQKNLDVNVVGEVMTEATKLSWEISVWIYALAGVPGSLD